MTDPVPCGICGIYPAINRNRRPASGTTGIVKTIRQINEDIAKSPPVQPAQEDMPIRCASVMCTSDIHPMLIVKTHECGSIEDAVLIWNESMGMSLTVATAKMAQT